MKSSKLKHYLRNIIAFHVFSIYQMFGLRVRVPIKILQGNPQFAMLINEDFLSCAFLKKDLLDGNHTSTNVPFILTIIVMMIKSGDVKISAKDHAGLPSLFNTRDGVIKSIAEGIEPARNPSKPGDQDSLWYMNHVAIRFTWCNSKSGKDKAVDLEDLFRMVVFGNNPFFDVNESKVAAVSKSRQEKAENDIFKDHFSRLDHLMKWLKKDDIIDTLKLQDKKVIKEPMTDEVRPILGWLSGPEMKNLKVILKKTDITEAKKRQDISDELEYMRSTLLAKATNITMHLSLWNSSNSLEDDDDDEEPMEPLPLSKLVPLSDESFNMLRKPRELKDEEKVQFPNALLSIRKEIERTCKLLTTLCQEDNCQQWVKISDAYEHIHQAQEIPSMQRLCDDRDERKALKAAAEGEVQEVKIDSPRDPIDKTTVPRKINFPPKPESPNVIDIAAHETAPNTGGKPEVSNTLPVSTPLQTDDTPNDESLSPSPTTEELLAANHLSEEGSPKTPKAKPPKKPAPSSTLQRRQANAKKNKIAEEEREKKTKEAKNKTQARKAKEDSRVKALQSQSKRKAAPPSHSLTPKGKKSKQDRAKDDELEMNAKLAIDSDVGLPVESSSDSESE